MKSFTFISLLFLIFQISVARVIPFPCGGYGSPVASPNDDSLSPSSVKSRAEAVGRMGNRLLATPNLGNGAGHQPSLTVETPIPTAQLMRTTMGDNACSASPLPSSPTRIPSWVRNLIAQDQKGLPTSATNSRQLHGAFIKKTAASLTSHAEMLPAQSQISEIQSAFTWDAYLDDVSILFDNFGPELVMVGVFILFPISILVAEALEILWRWWTPERFPERGRGRIRLTGTERRLKAWENWEREKLAEKSRKWWKPARKYR